MASQIFPVLWLLLELTLSGVFHVSGIEGQREDSETTQHETMPSQVSGEVVVNQAFVVTGSVRLSGIPVTEDICVELKGYSDGAITISGGKTLHGHLSRNIVESWGLEAGQPYSYHRVQRTVTQDGSFAFVTPERSGVLVITAYGYGGTYPTDHVVITTHDKGKAIARSGRVDVILDLGEKLKMHGLPWGSCARAFDNSPCSRINDPGDIWRLRAPTNKADGVEDSPYESTSVMVGEPSPSTAKDTVTGTTSTDETNKMGLTSVAGGIEGSSQETDLSVLRALLHTCCWDYGQFYVGSWHLDSHLCHLLYSSRKNSAQRRAFEHETRSASPCEEQVLVDYCGFGELWRSVSRQTGQGDRDIAAYVIHRLGAALAGCVVLTLIALPFFRTSVKAAGNCTISCTLQRLFAYPVSLEAMRRRAFGVNCSEEQLPRTQASRCRQPFLQLPKMASSLVFSYGKHYFARYNADRRAENGARKNGNEEGGSSLTVTAADPGSLGEWFGRRYCPHGISEFRNRTTTLPSPDSHSIGDDLHGQGDGGDSDEYFQSMFGALGRAFPCAACVDVHLEKKVHGPWRNNSTTMTSSSKSSFVVSTRR